MSSQTRPRDFLSLKNEFENVKAIVKEFQLATTENTKKYGEVVVKISKVQENQAEILSELATEFKETKEGLCSLKSEIDKILNQFASFDKELKEVIKKSEEVCEKRAKTVKCEIDSKTKAHLREFKDDVDFKIKTDKDHLSKKIKKVMQKNKPFGRNIVIHGIKKEEGLCGEVWFKKFCWENLNVKPVIEKGSIRKTKKGNFIGIFTLKSREEKAKVFKNCHKLKFSKLKVSVRDDFYEDTKDSSQGQHHTN